MFVSSAKCRGVTLLFEHHVQSSGITPEISAGEPGFAGHLEPDCIAKGVRCRQRTTAVETGGWIFGDSWNKSGHKRARR